MLSSSLLLFVLETLQDFPPDITKLIWLSLLEFKCNMWGVDKVLLSFLQPYLKTSKNTDNTYFYVVGILLLSCFTGKTWAQSTKASEHLSSI